MKIEMPFALPIAARITEIFVKPGERILPGQTLVLDFNRDLIRVPGDPGTGMLTVWLVAEYRALVSREQLAQMSRQGTVPQFPTSLHLLDNNNSGGLLLPAVQRVRFFE